MARRQPPRLSFSSSSSPSVSACVSSLPRIARNAERRTCGDAAGVARGASAAARAVIRVTGITTTPHPREAARFSHAGPTAPPGNHILPRFIRACMRQC
eukprot:364663-Chlamydomonas_euryale.AAC.8